MIFFKSKRGMSFINKAGAPNKRKTADSSGCLAEKGSVWHRTTCGLPESQRSRLGQKTKKTSIEAVKFATQKSSHKDDMNTHTDHLVFYSHQYNNRCTIIIQKKGYWVLLFLLLAGPLCSKLYQFEMNRTCSTLK